MAKARASKLKVFRTPIGFHDAYVAAPSQKAALEAWGSDSNLFAAGAAEPVVEPELMKVPLERPGEVIKVLRGTLAEQVAALGEAANAPRKKGGSGTRSGATKPAKPSRAELDSAEAEVEALRRKHAKAIAAIDRQIAVLERKRRELEREQGRDVEKAEARLASERDRFDRALAAWKRN